MFRTRFIFAMFAVAVAMTSCGSTAEPLLATPTSSTVTTTTKAPSTTAAAAFTTIAPATTATLAPDPEPARPWPSARLHPTFVHEPESGRMLMLSGLSQMGSSVDLREIWALNTADLTWEEIGDTKPLYSIQSFGYDHVLQRVLGYTLTPIGRIYSWDPANGEWNGAAPEGSPESTGNNPRFGVPFTYDVESERTVIFGGGSPWFMYGGTWAYDGATHTWEKMSPANRPSPRGMYAADYDSESDRVILWGGFTGDDENDVQVWAYDYNSDSWEALPNDEGPQQHWERHGMAYIPAIDRILVFSGMLENSPVFDPETWYFDYNTNTWTRVDVTTSPPGLAMYAMAYDPVTEKVYLFGGDKTSKYAGDLSNDLWVFDPVAEDWTMVAGPMG